MRSVACEAVILPLFVKLSNYISTRSHLSSSLCCSGSSTASVHMEHLLDVLAAAARDLLPAGSADLLGRYDDALIG